jgi:hypothetical protein
MAQVAPRFQKSLLSPKEQIIADFDLFVTGTPGIGSWLSNSTDAVVFERLATLGTDPLSIVQFKQLLVRGHQAPASDDFLPITGLLSPLSILTLRINSAQSILNGQIAPQ